MPVLFPKSRRVRPHTIDPELMKIDQAMGFIVAQLRLCISHGQ